MIVIRKFYKLFYIVVLSFPFFEVKSQGTITLSLHQDIRLLTSYDNHKNPPGTLDMLARIKLQGKQRKFGYFTIIPAYEQANLQKKYRRYSIDFGYTFNRLYLKNLNFIKNIELSISVGYGKIDHFSHDTYDWSGIGEITYKINDWLKSGIIIQITERTDLLYKYKDDIIRYSSFFGIEFSLFKLGKQRRRNWFN
jgi:hypothetical protein